ncbi:TspO/MBR family protein [Candidatus Enterococcus courvalinii]|uniref:Tryptophan-rich sensory protein n=1 Tax=Candidatus Enterococcus courvalinii TaxID=2815329 RepID=A0ABS3I068_9ENTE|nr:TspO/MBR family protein [Enterococcus sp. MSG2901]MBO0481557.1 tryptophan-rich sensory protein [Enterococcus sp. MSG2901]
MLNRFFKLLACIVGVELIGSVSGFFAGDIPAIYAQLNKPFLAPPGNIVGIIWTVLYALIGLALFLVIDSKSAKKKTLASVLFGVQLVLNFIWSILFFGGSYFWVASLISLFLLLTIIFSIREFRSISKGAAICFIPYLIWIAYATYLSFGLAILN